MCANCMATATASVGAASGLRAWAAAGAPDWLTPIRLEGLTAILLGLAVLVAGVGVS